MIDLKEKGLANAIKANGRFFLINTDCITVTLDVLKCF